MSPNYTSKNPMLACDNPLCFDCLVSPCLDAQISEARAHRAAAPTLQAMVRRARECVLLEREKTAKVCGLNMTRYRKVQAWANKRWANTGDMQDYRRCVIVERVAWVKHVGCQL